MPRGISLSSAQFPRQYSNVEVPIEKTMLLKNKNKKTNKQKEPRCHNWVVLDPHASFAVQKSTRNGYKLVLL